MSQRIASCMYSLVASGVVVMIASSASVTAAEVRDTGNSDSVQKIGAEKHRAPRSWTPKSSPLNFEKELEQQGYVDLRGARVYNQFANVKNENISRVDAYVLTKGILAGRHIKKVLFAYVTILERDSKGKAIYRLENAYEYDLRKREVPLESDDSGCISNAHPKHQVVAIGEWQWQKNPQLGGYAKTINYAWVADPDQKKLRPIPPETVVCKISDDRD